MGDSARVVLCGTALRVLTTSISNHQFESAEDTSTCSASSFRFLFNDASVIAAASQRVRVQVLRHGPLFLQDNSAVNLANRRPNL